MMPQVTQQPARRARVTAAEEGSSPGARRQRDEERHPAPAGAVPPARGPRQAQRGPVPRSAAGSSHSRQGPGSSVVASQGTAGLEPARRERSDGAGTDTPPKANPKYPHPVRGSLRDGEPAKVFTPSEVCERKWEGSNTIGHSKTNEFFRIRLVFLLLTWDNPLAHLRDKAAGTSDTEEGHPQQKRWYDSCLLREKGMAALSSVELAGVNGHRQKKCVL